MKRIGMTEAVQHVPAMPAALLPWPAMIPATCVPCPSPSTAFPEPCCTLTP
jgi:hypothetical protein